MVFFFSPWKVLVLGLGFRPNIEVDNELLGLIPLQYSQLKFVFFFHFFKYVHRNRPKWIEMNQKGPK